MNPSRKHPSLLALPFLVVALSATLLIGCDSGDGGGNGGGGDFNDIVGGGSGGSGGDGVIGGGGSGGSGGTGGTDGTGDATNGGGGVGDLDAVDTADGSIKALQVEAEQTGCDSTAIQDLRAGASVTGVVITSPQFEAADGLHGYYAADGDQAEWSGIMVTVPDTEGTNWQIGDVLDLTGTLQEAWCNTQLRVDAGGWAAGAPGTPVTPKDVSSPGSWEAYEGMLIKVSAATVEADAGGGRYNISGGLVVDHDFDFFLSLDVGDNYDIVGQVKFSFDEYKLMPRSEDDIVKVQGGGGGGPDAVGGGDGTGSGGGDAGPIEDVPTGVAGTVQQLQTSAYASGCDADNIMDLETGKTVDEAVVASPAFVVTETLTGYFVTDPEPAQWAGIMVTVPMSSGTDWKPGDRFSLTGRLQEAWCNTQFALDAGGWTALDPASTDAPTPLIIDDASDVEDWEPWEGTFVRIESELVVEALGGGTYLTKSGLVIDHEFDFFLSLEVGTSYDISGNIKYSFDQHRLLPHSEDHIVMVGGGGGSDATTSGDDDATTPDDDAGPVDPGPMPDEANTTVSDIQTSAESTGCTADEPQSFDDGLVVDAVVAVGSFEVSFTLNGYILTDGTQNPSSGILMVVPTGIDAQWAVGTQLRVSGQHDEFYCNTQLVADAVWSLGEGGVVPEPVLLGETETAAIEAWEGVVVELHDVSVTGLDGFEDYGDVETSAGVILDDEIIGPGTLFESAPELGTTWSVLRGVVTYSFGSYRLNPRTAADLIMAGNDTP